MWCTTAKVKLTRRGIVRHDGNIEAKSMPESRLGLECVESLLESSLGAVGDVTASLRRMQ